MEQTSGKSPALRESVTELFTERKVDHENRPHYMDITMKIIKKVSLFVVIAALVIIVIFAVYYAWIGISYGMAVNEEVKIGREAATKYIKEISFEGFVNEIDNRGGQITVRLDRIDSVPKLSIPLSYVSPFRIYNNTLYIGYKPKSADKLKKGILISKKRNADYLFISGDSISVYEIMDLGDFDD